MRRLAIVAERWPLAARFTISRGSKTEVVTVTVTLSESGATGRGEAVPYARYGESVDGVVDSLSEKFVLDLTALAPGEHLLVLRAADSANNSGLAKVVLK